MQMQHRGEQPLRPAFKCGPAENASAWKLMVEEFFGGWIWFRSAESEGKFLLPPSTGGKGR
jgi:hypothetical protein